VDESVRETGVGIYVVASVITPANECDALRKELRARGRFHFYKAGEPKRLRMLDWIGKCRLLVVAYVYRGLYPIGQEGARARCLASHLRDLGRWGVEELVIESRRTMADARDRVTVLSAINAGRIPESLAYDFKEADDEPLLWMADAVSSAVRAGVGTDLYKKELDAMPVQIRQVL